MSSSCTPPTPAQPRSLAAKVEWTPDFAKMREALLTAGMKDVAAETSKRLAADDARAKEILKCGNPGRRSWMQRDRPLSLSGAARLAA